MKIKVADYIIKFFADKGIDKIFVVYGAANGDLIDAFTRVKKTKYISIMHEQAAGFAVEGYSKIKNLPGVAIATSGPGGQNFVTSIANCYYDSVPGIFITGQIKTQFLRPDKKVRQIGFQETDIVGITKPITKKSVMIKDARKIKYELEHCYHLAMSGRPGPILLDVPMDIQKQYVEISKLRGFKAKKSETKDTKLKLQIKKFIKDFKVSKRPVLLVGGGVRTSGAVEELQELGKLMNVPVFPTWNALDIVTSDYSNYCGRVGTYGGAGRNFGIQNSDLLMTIGCRLSGRITGGNVQSFAREAKKYMVDIDPSNLKTKWQQLRFDENILCDAKKFIRLLSKEFLKKNKIKSDSNKKKWLETCIGWKNKYDPVKKEFFEKHNYVHPYAFIRTLSKKMGNEDTFVADCGGNIVISNHSFETKLGQRYFTNNGNSPMGFSFAGGLGACIANPKVKTVCVIGDGGMNMNIQELATLVNYKIKLKTIILNNHIYGITKAYQKTNFNGRMEACGPVGYNPPNFIEICKAYNVKTMELTTNSKCEEIIDEFLNYDDGPVVLDVNCHEFHTYEPRIFGWNTPIEDMYPYISREEFISNMKIKPLEGWKNPALPDSDKKNKQSTME